MDNYQKIYEAVKKQCQPGIDKFNASTLIRDVYNGMMGEAKAMFFTNPTKAKTWAKAMDCFRNTALLIWMQHPDYDEFQVLEELLPKGDFKKILEKAKNV